MTKSNRKALGINQEVENCEQACCDALHVDLRLPASARLDDLCWTLSPQSGVSRKFLDRQGGERPKRATSVVRYGAGAEFPEHSHDGGEEILVLDGTFSDASGDYSKGWYIRNPPGSSHAPYSKDGCQIFVKLGQMHRFDRMRLRLNTSCANADWQEGEAGSKSLQLFKSAYEHVALLRWPAGLKLDPVRFSGGLELLLLSGRFVDEFGDHHAGAWLRIPPGHGHQPRAVEDCLLYVKTGHLVF